LDGLFNKCWWIFDEFIAGFSDGLFDGFFDEIIVGLMDLWMGF
jgi:hypothetical protein